TARRVVTVRGAPHDGATLQRPRPADPRDDDSPDLDLYRVPAPARGGRRQDGVLAGAGRAFQPQLGAGPQGPGVLRRVRGARDRLLRVGPESRASAYPRPRSRVAGRAGRV